MPKYIIETEIPIDDCLQHQYMRGTKWYCELNAISVSDGYHTMEEVYHHRIALFAALCNMVKDVDSFHWHNRTPAWKSKLHSDGTMFEGGYFIAGIQTPNGQVTYHMKLKWWYKFRIPELERAPEYDGHKPEDVIERLLEL